MFVLVVGSAQSGKSRFSEKLCAALGQSLVYIATLVPYGDDEAGTARITRHRKQREGMGFNTIEKPFGFDNLALDYASTVLLEDAANLLCNHLFFDGGKGGKDDALRDIEALVKMCKNVVVVTLGGIETSDAYDAATNDYIEQLSRLNDELLELCEVAVKAKDQKLAIIKGELPPGVHL